MDPTTLALLQSGSALVGKAIDASRPGMSMQPLQQRSDGYAMGGYSDGANSGGATGGANGAANSTSFLDGSNWVVSTGKSTARADAQTSGAKPTFSTDYPAMYAPQNPFLGMNPLRGDNILPSLGNRIAETTGALGSGNYLLIGLVLITIVMLKK